MNTKNISILCLGCGHCGGNCGFFRNEVRFVADKRRRRITKLRFEKHPAVCSAQCEEWCVTRFKLAEVANKRNTKNKT